MPVVGAGLALAILAGSAPARGQVIPPASMPPSVATDSLASFERPNGALMRPGTLLYALSLVKPAGEVVPLGVRTVVVSDAAIGGHAGWLIADARTGTVVPTTDSVYLTRADLMVERWSASIGRSQLGASFTRDSAFGAVQTYQGRTSFSLAVPTNVLPSAASLERVLELLPLREGYHAAASLLLVEGGAPRVVPAEILVERLEGLAVGGQTIEAWRVALRWEAMEQRLWVARAESRVIRTEQAVSSGVMVSELKR